MRRILLTLVAATAMVAVTPGLALAHRHHRHHHRSHHHAARTHHRRVRHRRFGSGWSQSGDQQGTAGTVTSFDNGVLTITLNNGNTVSGDVTDSTELECTAPSSANPQNEDGDQGGGGDNSSGGDDQNEGAGEDQGEDQGQNQGDEQGEDQGEDAQSCGTSALTPGTTVAEAELKISSAGSTWQKVELVTS
ncbi:MAG: hypothetical protein ACJ764_01135 [Solirubrobacteraceae bacterium]